MRSIHWTLPVAVALTLSAILAPVGVGRAEATHITPAINDTEHLAVYRIR